MEIDSLTIANKLTKCAFGDDPSAIRTGHIFIAMLFNGKSCITWPLKYTVLNWKPEKGTQVPI
jgi:hypothetical protein